MASEPTHTTLPRRILGRRLRELREERKISRANAAAAIELGSQTLWRLESGRNSEVKKMYVNALCDLYEASAEDRRLLIWLAQESRKDGWWQSYTDAMVPEVELFVGLEQSARRVVSWQSTLLPGLLQTPDYRHAMWQVSTTQGRAVDGPLEIDLVQKRQARLDDPDFTLDVLLSESALRHRIGDTALMRAQLHHLTQLTARPNICIRVVPFTAPNHIGLTTKDFVYLEFPTHQNPALTEPPVVYVEGFTGDLYLDKTDEVSQYLAAITAIEQVALDQHDTTRLIEAAAKEYPA